MERLEKNPILDGKIGREMLIFFFPILFGYLFQQVYNTADAMIVGRCLGKIALSAVGGSSGMIILMVVGFFVGLASGASVLVSQYYGAKDGLQVEKAVHTVITFSMICGLFIMIFGMLTAEDMLRWMKTPEDTMDMSILYLRTYFAGMVGNMIYNVGSGILRAVGDSKRPFIFLMVSCFLNIILDLLFVIIFGMGVFGAALATIISQFVSAFLVILVMLRVKTSYGLVPSKLSMDASILKHMFIIGLPAGLQAVMYGISNIIIQMGVNDLGTDYVAAWATYYKIDGVFWMTISAYGIVAATFVGQNYGAKKYDRVKRSIFISLGQALVAATMISLLVYYLCPWIFPLFTTDAQVNRIGIDMMRYLTRFYILYVSIELLSGSLRGAGDTMIPMMIAGIGVCLLRSVWILCILPLYKNMYTLMFSYPISWALTSIAFFIYLIFFSRLRHLFRTNGK